MTRHRLSKSISLANFFHFTLESASIGCLLNISMTINYLSSSVHSNAISTTSQSTAIPKHTKFAITFSHFFSFCQICNIDSDFESFKRKISSWIKLQILDQMWTLHSNGILTAPPLCYSYHSKLQLRLCFIFTSHWKKHIHTQLPAPTL